MLQCLGGPETPCCLLSTKRLLECTHPLIMTQLAGCSVWSASQASAQQQAAT